MAVVVQLLLGCAGMGDRLSSTGGSGAVTVMGNYEAIAGCVKEAGDKSLGGSPVLSLDRPARTAKVRRVLAGGELQYELAFVQTGVTTVMVDGRSISPSPEAKRGFDFLWPQVSICAANLTAP